MCPSSDLHSVVRREDATFLSWQHHNLGQPENSEYDSGLPFKFMFKCISLGPG